MAIDYTSTPLPANGQARSAAAIAAAFSNVQTVYNAFETATNTALASHSASIAAATSTGSLANAGKLAKFAGDGGMTFAGALNAAAIAASSTITATGTIATNSNLVAAGVIVAGSGSNQITTAAGLLDAAKLTNTVLFDNIVADYKATPGTAGVINLAAGGPWLDSNGNVVPGANAQTVNLPTQPATTHFEYIGISLSPTTGAPVVTTGTLDAAESSLVIPVTNRAIASIRWDGVTTLPTGVVASASIKNLRWGSGGGGGGGGAGVDSAARAVGVWTGATPGAIFTNSLDSTNSATNARMHPNLIKRGTNAADTTLDVLMTNWVQPDTASRISVSGATVTLAATVGSPWAVAVGSTWRYTTSSLQATASGSAGQRYLVADASSTLALALQTTPAGTNQLTLAAFWFDGSILRPSTSVDYSAIGSITSGNVQLQSVSCVGTNTTPTITGSSTIVANSAMPTTTFYLPKPAVAFMAHNAGWFAVSGGAVNSQFIASLDGNAIGAAAIFVSSATGAAGFFTSSNIVPVPLAAGSHTITQNAFVTTGNSLQVYGAQCGIYLFIFM